jgi:hypothetical protein
VGIAVQFAGKANASDRLWLCCAAMSCTGEAPARKFSRKPGDYVAFPTIDSGSVGASAGAVAGVLPTVQPLSSGCSAESR